jgi:hypothetical protein
VLIVTAKGTASTKEIQCGRKKNGNYPIRIRQNESLKKQRNNQKHKEGHVQSNKSVNYIFNV